MPPCTVSVVVQLHYVYTTSRLGVRQVPIEILVFLFDEENEDKIWEHGFTPADLVSVLSKPHAVKRNRENRAASHLVVGKTDRGACVAIPIERTHDPYTWRPVTAWPCKRHEADWCP